MDVGTYQLRAGQQFIAIIGGSPNEVGALDPNLPPADLPAGTLGVQIIPLAGGIPVLPRTTAGIQQQLPGSGIYSVVLTAPALTGDYSVIWDYVDSHGTDRQYAQTLSVDTSIPVSPQSGGSMSPVYISITAADPNEPCLTNYIPGIVIDDTAALNALIVRCELEIDSTLGFWIRDPSTGRKINMDNIVPVAPISPFPGELFAPYQRGITIYQKFALKLAVCAQVEYHLKMGEDFFREAKYDSVSGPQFSRSGTLHSPWIAPKARQHLAQTGLVRRVARMTI